MTSKVILAEHDDIQAELALKVFRPNFIEEHPTYYKHIVSEISILKGL